MSQSHPLVLVFGESHNDRLSLARLIEALCAPLAGRVQPVPQPVSLNRNASSTATNSWIAKIAQVVRNQSQPVICVFVHRDSDAPDPNGRLQQQTRQALTNAGLSYAHAVVPVEEIESWWLLFPDATERVRQSWSGTLPRSRQHVDGISQPKERLRRLTKRGDSRHSYSESDSPTIAQYVAEAIRSGQTPQGTSPSYNRFVASVKTCCSNSSND